MAYVVLSQNQFGWTLEEAGDRDPAGARLGAILQVLVAREPVDRAAADSRVVAAPRSPCRRSSSLSRRTDPRRRLHVAAARGCRAAERRGRRLLLAQRLLLTVATGAADCTRQAGRADHGSLRLPSAPRQIERSAFRLAAHVYLPSQVGSSSPSCKAPLLDLRISTSRRLKVGFANHGQPNRLVTGGCAGFPVAMAGWPTRPRGLCSHPRLRRAGSRMWSCRRSSRRFLLAQRLLLTVATVEPLHPTSRSG